MLIYLTGQNNFGNRGCEALVRSTVLAVREVLPQARFLVPSVDIARDAAQWPEAGQEGVELVPVPAVPWLVNKWGGLCLRLPAVAAGPWPGLPADGLDARYIGRADLVLSIGGDNYSLDYGVASLAYFVAVAEMALARGKPVALWGASVGPFSRMPAVERHMAAHLRRLAFVSVRESRSVAYLAGIGVRDNVVPVVDTAFLMQPQFVDVSSFWPAASGAGTVGLNISWLIEHVRRSRGLTADVVQEASEFVRRVMMETDLAVLLLPHVAPLDGAELNSDDMVNKRIFERIPLDYRHRIGYVPPGFNAAQLKFVVSQCRFLLAARTHATIAAFSTGVPTISIAYSVKAEGINEDLFGDTRLVLPTHEVSAETLYAGLLRLLAEEGPLREHYRARLAGWRESAMAGARRLLQSVVQDR